MARAYILLIAGALFLSLGLAGVAIGEKEGCLSLLIGVLCAAGSRLHFWLANMRRQRWLELALMKEERARAGAPDEPRAPETTQGPAQKE